MRTVQLVLYRLKQHFGGPIVLVHVVASETNRDTGQRTDTQVEYNIRRAVIIPEDMRYITDRQVDFQLGDREIIIDSIDLASEFQFGRYDYVLISNVKYSIIFTHKLQDADGYYLHIRNLQSKKVT